MITKTRKAIAASGTTAENEPIIKSDGASSDVMQWLSNDESSNITISEDGSNNLLLGVGTGTPDKTFHVRGSSRLEATTDPTMQLKRAGNAAGNGSIECLGSDDSVDYAIPFEKVARPALSMVRRSVPPVRTVNVSPVSWR